MSATARGRRVLLPTMAWVALIIGGATPVCGAAESVEPEGAQDAAISRCTTDAYTLAAKIDTLIAMRWNAERVEPAPPADDAEFLRRVYLDLYGKIPPVSEVRRFLDDASSDNRQRLIDRLLDGPGYVSHFTNVWRAAMLPDGAANMQIQFLVPGFEAWVRKNLAEGAGYDKTVSELITMIFPGDGSEFNPYAQTANPTPIAFYMASELKPESLAASTSRLFLGVKLECAQCHNHPFADWTREQFWSFAAFFSGVRQQRPGLAGAIQEVFNRQGLPLPGTDKFVVPRFLDNAEPDWKPGSSARKALANWITSPANPYFARAAVNRIWTYFFGAGLVDLAADIDGESAETNRKLLDELAGQFAAHDFDLKFLIRAITNSRVYQLTSAATRPGDVAPALLARMAVRGLSPEQLFDALVQATGFQERDPMDARPFNPFDPNAPRAEFLSRFAQQGADRTAQETTILQALSLMNGRITADSTSLDRSQTLGAVADLPLMDTAERIETLYLATLSRRPRPDEMARMHSFVEAGGASGNLKEALADVFWALLNCGEFMLNH